MQSCKIIWDNRVHKFREEFVQLVALSTIYQYSVRQLLKLLKGEKLTRKLHDLFVSHQVQLVENGVVLCEIFILVLLLFPAEYWAIYCKQKGSSAGATRDSGLSPQISVTEARCKLANYYASLMLRDSLSVLTNEFPCLYDVDQWLPSRS